MRDMSKAAGFLSERQDYLYVYAAPSMSGDGFDVVIRVDGTYDDQATAQEAAEGIRHWIEGLEDVDASRRVWWHGPPFELDPRPRPFRELP